MIWKVYEKVYNERERSFYLYILEKIIRIFEGIGL